MPLNETQFRVARALNKKQQQRLWGLADREGTTFEDPEYAKTRKNFEATSGMIRDYETANRKVDEAGKVTSEPPTHLPAVVEAAPKAAEPGQPPLPATTDEAYFFEPSIPEVQTLLRKRPEVAMRAGLDPKWLTGVASPEKSEPVLDPLSGMQMGSNQVAARTHLDELTTDRSAYKDIANYLYKERSDEARQKGTNLKRYRDIPLKGNIPDFLKGGAIYNIERRLTPGVLGVADAATMGLASPGGDYLTKKIGDAASAFGVDIGPQPTSEDVRNRSPMSYAIGNLYGYGLPRNPTNALQEGVYNASMKAAGKAGLAGAGTKALASVAAGGTANAAEGAVRQAGEDLGSGESFTQAGKDAVSGIPLNYLMGGGLGGVAELGGALAGVGRENIRTQDHLMMPLKALREGGGDTDMLRGVVAPKEVHGHIRSALEDGAVGSPAARAADEVAPRIQESLEKQDVEAGTKIGAQMEQYYAHPAYRDVRVSSKPLVQALVDMVGEGRFHAPVTGAPMHMDQDVVRTIQREVVGHKWAEPEYHPREAAQEAADEVDGIIVDLDTAKDIFGSVPDDVAAGDVAVIVPKHMTAKELTRFEDKVYGKLKPREDGSMVESPVYKKLDTAAKEVRDKFEYYEDAEGRLVAPPGKPSGGPRSATGRPPASNGPGSLDEWNAGAPARAARIKANRETLERINADEPESLRPSEYEEIPPSDPGSSEAQTVERQSEGEEQLGSADFIPQTQELGSDDFLTRSGVELNSADFDPATAASGAGRPTARLRDLRRRAVPQGPQKGEYDNHNDYLMARANWRRQEGKATAADKARFKKAADAIPPTERSAGVESSVPQTKRSIAPDEATPLSLLAGNKLAMDVPEPPREPTERLVRPKKPDEYPDESLPGPMAKDWTESTKETGDWYEDIVSPGRDPRSDEAKRMGDLMAQREAHDAAEGQIRNAEDRLGPMEPNDRIQSILNILSEKLGREVTKEDLVRAGLMGTGVAAAASDDENVQRAGAMAIIGGGKGFKKGFPRQLEAKLDDGSTVRGFSALRRKQHDMQTGVETAKRRVGASNEKTVKDRVMEYNLENNIDFDRALLDEAKKLGLEKELRTAAATRVYPKLKRQAWGGSNKGSLEGLASFLGLRADKLFELLSGTPRNPFDRSPNLMMRDNLREQFNLRGGRTGARYGDDLRKSLLKEDEDEPNATP